ncbi:MAG: phosphomannose isomerase type II C-terminal cupin domain [bacterium]
MNSKKLSFPWGTEDLFVLNTPVTVKFLYVKKGEAPSLQYHHHREEFWRVVSGNPELTIGAEKAVAHPGEEFNIPKETQHRISATTDDVVVLEISTGEFDEADIIRLEDKYGRITS